MFVLDFEIMSHLGRYPETKKIALMLKKDWKNA